MEFTEKWRGQRCYEESEPRKDLKGYDWKVIVDPTCKSDDQCLFRGRLFRMVDLQLDRDEVSTWPNGIVFENAQTGRRLTYENGKLMDLTNAKVLGRKPRQRNRNHKISNEIHSGTNLLYP